jgi:hypothetical protein
VAQYENLTAIPTEPTSVITTAICKPEIGVCQQEMTGNYAIKTVIMHVQV